MIRTLTVLASLLALAAVVAIDSPVRGGEAHEADVFLSPPQTANAVCPGPQHIPVGDIQSGDADLDSGSADVQREVLPRGPKALGAGVVFNPLGISVERIGTGDLAGLAALTCAPTAREQWLVGGATTLGSSARLVLSNPAGTSVSASIAVYTPVGESAQETSVVLGPGAQRELLLEAIEPEMPGLAVRIKASGAGVSAALQDSRLTGFLPAGSDWVTASALGTSLAVPVPSATDSESSGRVALVAPTGAEVTLAMTSVAGDVPWLGQSTHTLAPGVLTELPIPAAEGGVVTIEATAPVAASSFTRIARESATGDAQPAYDFAWSAAQNNAENRRRAVVIPALGESTLLAYSPQPGTYEFMAGGQTWEVDIASGGVTRVPIEAAAGTVLSSDAAVSWVVVLTDEPGFLSSLEPVPIDPTSIETAVSVGGYFPRD